MNGKPGQFVNATQAYQAVVDALATAKGVTAARMFGSQGLKVDGRVFVMRFRDSLVAKLPSARVAELVAAKVGVNFAPGHGRIMREWIEIEEHHAHWLEVAREALAFVRGSDDPPKPKVRRRP